MLRVATRTPSLLLILASATVVFYMTTQRKQYSQPDPFKLVPSGLPQVKDSTLFDSAYQDQMFWGTYRPGFYAGEPAPS
jgi:hypothetical protein